MSEAELFIKAESLAQKAVILLTEAKKTVASAESCTGGLLAKLLTDISGSSAVFPGGIVSYTNEVKEKILGVDRKIIDTVSEVSTECAEAMAKGAKSALGANFALSTTGFAGPTGGTEKDPVGTVYIGFASNEKIVSERFSAPAGSTRAEVRYLAAIRALEILLKVLG